MIKAIIFDAYGTIISTGNGSINAARKILEINNRTDIPAEEFYARWKKIHRMHIDELFEFICEEKIFQADLEKLYTEYGLIRDAQKDVAIMLESLTGRVAFPESRQVLNKLSDHFVTCIGSTSDTVPLLYNLKKNQLIVHRIFTSESLGVYKPKADFYTGILKELGTDASDALFVGDSLLDDIWGPQQIGIKTCWVNRNGAKYENIKPDFQVNNLTAIINILGLD